MVFLPSRNLILQIRWYGLKEATNTSNEVMKIDGQEEM